MTSFLLQESSALPTTVVEIVSPVPSLKNERQCILHNIRSILEGWYARGAMSISIDGVPAFSNEDQCISVLERSRLSEIQRIHCLLTGKR